MNATVVHPPSYARTDEPVCIKEYFDGQSYAFLQDFKMIIYTLFRNVVFLSVRSNTETQTGVFLPDNEIELL
jgi:hypothetical protein